MEDIEKSKAELLAAGMSQQAVDGLAQITITAHSDCKSIDNPAAGIKAVFKMFGDFDSYMKTQSEADQAIFKEVILKQAKKK